jgi:peptidoglycan biosynthesis protein MviN/MurJ (putative lipid II flippase)
MALIMFPLLFLAMLAGLGYGLWRVVRKWGLAGACMVVSVVSFVAASGVLAEHLWGPQWSWNFAHHGAGYAESTLVQGVVWLAIGLLLRAKREIAN